MNRICLQSPVGKLVLTESDGAISGLCFGECGAEGERTPLIMEAARQLEEYFEGKRRAFDLPLSPQGTSFQKKVWQALCDIPFGETRSYAEIARAVNSPKAFRAVGMANHRNPVLIMVPCHRVVGADGSMTGYAGGMDKKRFLLELEGIRIK